ncbi:MAG: hypothetical protein Q4F00_07060 [bacterium]|nr:hypothetical protein [bacterium]
MGFISFNDNYYRLRLEALENKALTREDVYEAQQLLKVLDDLEDEGYTNLNRHLENSFSCLTRLRTLLRNSQAAPFPLEHDSLPPVLYSPEEYELQSLLDTLIAAAEKHAHPSGKAFLQDIYRYCGWLEAAPDTAYVFLLRDALLPYVFFRSRQRARVYPWLISRSFLDAFTRTQQADDELRLPLYEALEYGYTAFPDFCAYCRERILRVLDRHTPLKTLLLELLGSVSAEHIAVIESGYIGTIPMLLKALDDRVSFRLYTTAPFLYETYRDLIFCRRYEDIRRFETLYSQDLLLRFSSFRSGKFYVNTSSDASVREHSLQEIKYFIS